MQTAARLAAALALAAGLSLPSAMPVFASGDAGGIYGDANPHNQPNPQWQRREELRSYSRQPGYGYGYNQPDYGYRQPQGQGGWRQPRGGYQQPGYGGWGNR